VRLWAVRDSSLGLGAAGGVDRHSHERAGATSANSSVDKIAARLLSSEQLTVAESLQQQAARMRFTQHDRDVPAEPAVAIDAEASPAIDTIPKNATKAIHFLRKSC
jgi:hypothetical protein